MSYICHRIYYNWKIFKRNYFIIYFFCSLSYPYNVSLHKLLLITMKFILFKCYQAVQYGQPKKKKNLILQLILNIIKFPFFTDPNTPSSLQNARLLEASFLTTETTLFSMFLQYVTWSSCWLSSQLSILIISFLLFLNFNKSWWGTKFSCSNIQVPVIETKCSKLQYGME